MGLAKRKSSWRAFLGQALVLWGAGVVGYLALTPYLRVLLQDRLSKATEELGLTLNVLLLINGIQSAVIVGVCVMVGLLCAPRVGLSAPLSASLVGIGTVAPRAWFRTMIGPSVAWGGGLAVLVIALELGLRPWTAEGLQLSGGEGPNWWQGLLASFYGGITEELQLRLGLLTLFAWVLHRLFAKFGDPLPGWMFWMANLLAALLFGLGHLPAVAALTPLTSFVVFRTLLLNGILALAFGALYRRYGLEAAIVSHFAADIVLHVIPQLALG